MTTTREFDPEKEYYTLFEAVNEFDKRLIVVKGWSVTLSLVGLGAGFEAGHQGLFLAAAITSLGFWMLDGLMKQHQMRYYVRMREIEVATAESASGGGPRIDWSWSEAVRYLKGEAIEVPDSPKRYGGDVQVRSVLGFRVTSYQFAWFLPHVLLPHIIGFAGGFALLAASLLGAFGDLPW
jgi:hypothetical protein